MAITTADQDQRDAGPGRFSAPHEVFYGVRPSFDVGYVEVELSTSPTPPKVMERKSVLRRQVADAAASLPEMLRNAFDAVLAHGVEGDWDVAILRDGVVSDPADAVELAYRLKKNLYAALSSPDRSRERAQVGIVVRGNPAPKEVAEGLAALGLPYGSTHAGVRAAKVRALRAAGSRSERSRIRDAAEVLLACSEKRLFLDPAKQGQGGRKKG